MSQSNRIIAFSTAEFKRDIIRERTAGLSAARARKQKGGRPKAMNVKKIHMAKAFYKNKDKSIDGLCQSLKISRTTLYKYLDKRNNYLIKTQFGLKFEKLNVYGF